MKIGIITFQETNNYGAVLQNYALHQALVRYGHEVQTIDYQSSYIGKPYRLEHLKNKGLFAYLFGVMGYFIYLPRTKKCKEFRKYIHYSRKVNKQSISEINNEFDLFITGSDQVWNYNLTDLDETYMLGFVSDKSKCNSFAASIGLSEISEENKTIYKNLLKDYHFISVREKSAVPLLADILFKDIQVVSDPCVLLNQADWDKVSKQPQIKGKYLLVYQLGISADAVKLAKRISKEKKLKVVYIPFPVGCLAKGKWDIGAGNAELLGYIKDAEYVVTDSFHGTLLSIIYNKRFFTKMSGTHAGVGSRIYDILEHYGLTDRILNASMDYEKSIDYNKVNKLMETDRKYSQEVLQRIIDQ